MCQTLIFLDEPMAVADVLEKLSKGTLLPLLRDRISEIFCMVTL